VAAVVQQAWSPGVAAVLSLVIPGAGQMYKGQVVNGLVWLLFTVIGYAALILPGLIIHICCIVGAASGNPAVASGSLPTVAGRDFRNPTPRATRTPEQDAVYRAQNARLAKIGVVVLLAFLSLAAVVALVSGPPVKNTPALTSTATPARDSSPSQTPASAQAAEYSSPPAAKVAEMRRGALTYENYLRLQEGMSYTEVVEILGSPGEEISRSELAGYTTVMYQWKKWNGPNMNVMLQNGRMVQKAQFGLN
jgi:TM2 domain-containing membrane protein YozV